MRWSAGWTGLVLLLLLMGVLSWILSGRWHPSDARYPIQGIDVSHHQGSIAWAKLRAQGVDFAYIKATEGGDYRDPTFLWNWTQARTAGVRPGAYHFFTLCRSGADQADNFIGLVPRDPTALPPALDLEFLGNCSTGAYPAEVRSEIAAFLQRVERAYGRPVTLYLTREFDEAYGISATFKRPLWLRSLVRKPNFGTRPWSLWQASNFRRLDGISGRVDWNVAAPPGARCRGEAGGC